jgi:hypothetical protein
LIKEHLGNIQGTFREHSGNIQGIFRELQGTKKRGSVDHFIFILIDGQLD